MDGGLVIDSLCSFSSVVRGGVYGARRAFSRVDGLVDNVTFTLAFCGQTREKYDD